MQKYLYHTTPIENIQSILDNGLVRRGAFICLSESRNSWMASGNALFRVHVKEYMNDNPDVTITTWLPESDEICVWNDIDQRYVELECT